MTSRIDRFVGWLDSRSGIPTAWRAMLDEQIKGGARWAYALGGTLLVLFLSQALTGLLLMATYSPSVHDAWSSVYYINDRVTAGWFLRGMHHYGAGAVMITLGLHLAQVCVYGAYKKPRELNWWVGLVLLQLIVFLAISGYLLPWDQKGYWATTVATNIAGSMPVAGPSIRDAVVGGASYGQSTLTRVYAAHVGVLPALIAMVVALHLGLRRRHGYTPPGGADLTKVSAYGPSQLLRDASLATLAIGTVAAITVAMHGAPLDAPADPSVDYPPRPEWYFLWLYQLLNLVPAKLEILVTLGIPALLGGFLAALPIIDRKQSNRVRDRLAFVSPVLVVGLAIGGLTMSALMKDKNDPRFQEQRRDADRRAARAIALARSGIPAGGPLAMLANDPLTRGRDVYAAECTGCHRYEGRGDRHAPDHTGFGSRAWILALLHEPNASRFFGETEHDEMPSQSRLGEDTLHAITEFLFAEGREPQDPPIDAALVARGRDLFESKCMGCHTYQGDGDYDGLGGPNLTLFGSRTWIRRQIVAPNASSQYGSAGTMPAFGDELSAHDLDMLAGFLRLERFRD